MKGENMKYPLMIVLWIVVILTAGCVSENNGSVSENNKSIVPPTQSSSPTPNIWLKNCSSVKYDSRYQTCCGTTLFNISAGFVCCGGVYIDNSYGSDFSCCYNDSDPNVGTVYNTNNEHCCNGVLGAEGPNSDWKKCGNECYYINKESCCCERVISVKIKGKVST